MKKIINNNTYISNYKELMKEWNFKKNIGKNPIEILSSSDEVVWWKCERGHEYQAKIIDKVKGKKCTGCSTKKVIIGLNDLETIYPNLALEWNYERNKDLTPRNVKIGSNKKVWWKCKNGHEWEAVISSRCYGTGCPYCAGKKLLIGFNDLKTKYPVLSEEWNNEKNNELTPQNVTFGSNKKVWWKCKNGHEWQADISARTRGNGCPYCAGHKAIEGKNDLQTMCPELAKQWDYSKNINISPKDVSYKSHKKVWWVCDKGHSWNSTIASRTKGNGCAVCSGKKIIEGINDLATTNPKLASEWNYQKNGDITPQNIGAGSNKKVWWKCEKGHEFEGVINTRNYKKSNCPICSNRKIVKGINDLRTLNPKLAEEWNRKRNKDIKITEVGTGSNKVVWWKCKKKGHEWKASINDRNRGHGCPYCKGREKW